MFNISRIVDLVYVVIFTSTIGCTVGGSHGPNSFEIAHKSAQELTLVSDVDLCHAQRFWRSQKLMNEISLRNLDCNVIATRQSTTTLATENGSKDVQGSAKMDAGSKASLESISASEQIRATQDIENCIEYFVQPPNKLHTLLYHSTNNVKLDGNQNTLQGMPKIIVNSRTFYPVQVSYTNLTHYGMCDKKGFYLLNELPENHNKHPIKESDFNYP